MKTKKADVDSSSMRKGESSASGSSARTCRNCCLWVTSIILSPVGLGLFVLGYCVMGAFLFRAVEAQSELDKWNRVAALEKTTINELWAQTELFKDGVGMNRSEFEGNVRRLVRDLVLTAHEPLLRERVREMDSDGGWDNVNSHYAMQWTFAGALLYSISIITTVGYCHVIPHTTSGQLLTILYALIGIPLFVGYLVKVGRCLANGFRAFYRVVCCDLLCCEKCERKKRRRVYSFSATDDLQSVSLNGAVSIRRADRVGSARQRDQTISMTSYVTSPDEQTRDPTGSCLGDVELMKQDRSAQRTSLNAGDYDVGSLGKWNASGKRYSTVSKTPLKDLQSDVPTSVTNLSANQRRGMNHVYERIPYSNQSAAQQPQLHSFPKQQLPVVGTTLSLLDEGAKYDHSGRRNIVSGTRSLQHKPKSLQRQPSSTTDTRSRQGKYYGDSPATASLDRKQTREHVSRSPVFTPPRAVSAADANVSANTKLRAAAAAGQLQVSKDKRQSLQQSHRDVLAASLKLEEARKSRQEKPEELALSVQGLKFINRRSNPIVTSDYSAASVAQPATRAAARIQRSISADTKPQTYFTPAEVFRSNAAQSCVEKDLKRPAAPKTSTSEQQQKQQRFRHGRENLRESSPTRQKVRTKIKNPNKNDRVLPAAVRRSNDSFVTAPSDDSSQREPSTSVNNSSDDDIARSNRPRITRKKSMQLPAAPKQQRATKNEKEERANDDDVFVTSSQPKRRRFGRFGRTRPKKDKADENGSDVAAPASHSPSGAVSVVQRDFVLLEETYSPDDSFKPRTDRSGEGGGGGGCVTKQPPPHRVSVPISMTLAVLIVYVASGTLLFSAWENVDYLVGSYFCFMTLTTIGIGDVTLLPGNNNNNNDGGEVDYYTRGVDEKRVVCSVWLACGLSVVAMCVSLAYDRLVDRCADGGDNPGDAAVSK